MNKPNSSRTAELVRRDADLFFHQEGSSPCLSALRGVGGAWLEDADGKRYLDFHGNSVHHIGHAHPRLLAAIEEQLRWLAFSPRRYTNEPAVALAEKLVGLWPGESGRVLFATGGSDAIEIALKLARVATGRHETISFIGSYHGDGLGAIGLAGERAVLERLGPLLPGQHHVTPFWGATDAPERSLESIEATLRRNAVGALIAEPVRSTPHIPPDGYWNEVRRLCDRHGALLIFDEIPTGLGKTGRWFSSQHFGVAPDISVLGKSLGGGVLPIAAVIGSGSLNVAPELNLGHYTHEKNPVTARAALTTLQILEDEKLIERSATLGQRTLERLHEMAKRVPAIEHARGIGMLMILRLREPQLAEKAFWRCLERGLSLTVKEGGRSLGISPPLMIPEDELDSALRTIEEVLLTH